MRSAIICALGALAVVGPAHAGPAEDLADAFRGACRTGATPTELGLSPSSDYGLIKAADVRDAIGEAYPASGQVLVGRPLIPDDKRTNIEWLAQRAFQPPEKPTDAESALIDVGKLVDGWLHAETPTSALPLRGGGLRVVAPGLSREEAFARLMTGDDTGLTLVCRYPSPPPPTARPDRVEFRLVKTPEDLDEKEVKDRKFAEFSYGDDRQARAQSWGVVATAALEFPEFDPGGDGGYLHWKPRLYVAYERKGDNDPSSDGYVNNLVFGGRVTGDLGLGSTWFGYYALSATAETDDKLESEAYAGEVRLDPPLPLIPYHRYEQQLFEGPGMRASAVWNLDLVADWRQIDDPGSKTALEDGAEYVRLGYDAGFKVRAGPSRHRDDWAVALLVDYSIRDGQNSAGGDAQFFTSSLQFEPDEASTYTFGLSYERGENLESFESSELWKLFFGLRY